jgi:biopolymer transport protein ExbD
MAMAIQTEEEEDLSGAINVTPLVDVMLVMLIIFLITIPVVIQNIPVTLPKVSNIASITKPEHIVISVVDDGRLFVGMQEVTDREELRTILKEKVLTAVNEGKPLPEVHIRGDEETRFEFIGQVIIDVQRSNIAKIAFTTEPDAPTR